MSLPRMLVLDLDGTAITREGLVTPEDQAAAGRLRALGVHITIATGRLWPGTQSAARQLGITDTVAVMNGSELVHAGTGMVQARWSVPVETREAVRRVCRARPVHSLLFASDTIHFPRAASAHRPYLHIWSERLTAHHDLFAAPQWSAGPKVLGVSMIGDAANISALKGEISPILPPQLGMVGFATFTGERFLEVRHIGQDKGTALRRLAAERDIDPADTVAVGDWFNDLPLLRAAGHAFVMDGADPEVVAVADGVLPAQRGEGGAVAAVAQAVWGV